MCDNFSPKTGTCSDAKLIVDSWDVSHGSNGHDHGSMMDGGMMHHNSKENSKHSHSKRGLDLMNVQIDEATNTLFTGYFDKYRNSFEILFAPLRAPITLQSYFRTAIVSSNNACRMACCEDSGHTYFKVQPRDFAVDKGDIFVSWDAFYQDCSSSSYTAKAGLKWTVGVSKILTDNPDCVRHDRDDSDQEVSFAECTKPVAIAFQDSEPRKKLLGYAGLAIANTGGDFGKRLFFLSALHQVNVNELNNELWIVKEGDVNTGPDVVEVDSVLAIDHRFADISVDDVGSMRLRKDGNGVPTGLCRTAYDAAIVCHRVRVDSDGNAELWTKNTYVTKEKVAESCSVAKSDHYPATKLISSVATGLEVFWSDDSTDDNPDYVIFGCYGEMNYHGNITTAFGDKRIVQTIAGAYPGSVLKGVDVHRAPEPVVQDSFPAPNHDFREQYQKKYRTATRSHTAPSSTGPSGFFLVCVLLLGAIVLFIQKRTHRQQEVIGEYEQVVQVEYGETSNASYVEMASSS
jgi:hypothetical protein